MGIFNSSTFYFYWEALFDAFKVGKYSVEKFPFVNKVPDTSIKELISVSKELITDLKNNSKRIKVNYKNTGNVIYDRFFPRESKSYIDQIDKKLASIYRFSKEELDFILNYNIKYRMDKEIENGEKE